MLVMVEFYRTISAAEVNKKYLNLTDDAGETFGAHLDSIPHLARMAIVDSLDRTTFAKKHHSNQIWGALRNWYSDNKISAGTRILIKYDPSEQRENCPVLHLNPESITSSTIKVVEQIQAMAEAAVENEIPVSLERQLEDFLAANLEMIEKGLTLYADEDGHEGRQYPTEIGIIDLLCRRADGTFLVIELKRGKIGAEVVGQISRYVGWVMREIAEGKLVSGLILSHKPDKALEYAVLANPNLKLRYFRLRLDLLPAQQIEK